MADVAADVNGIVTTDSTWSRGERVGGTEDRTAGLHGVTAFPDHSTDGTAAHVGNETWEEGLVGEILIVLLEMSLGWGGELDGGKFEATVLEAGDYGADQATLDAIRLDSNEGLLVGGHVGFLSLFCLYFEGFAEVSSVLKSYTAEDERV